ncbi:murein hydrolase activator EnvC family protein [Streptomyces ardesiacus]|uniref:murein hydrolase activator EnvC family protein n=1 Tax=Streptomyces ardesiacus TaxID=285564 RepID=UPI0036379F0A
MRMRRWVSACARPALLPATGTVLAVLAVLAVLTPGPPRPTPAGAAVTAPATVPGERTGPAGQDGRAGQAGQADSAASAGGGLRKAPAPAVPALARCWPVGVRPAVLRGWEPPATPYGPGHRGVDLAAAGGTPVRAVAAGRVSFAGPVAGRGVVSLELAGTGEPPLRTTYTPVEATVEKGDEVAAGEVLGTVGPAGSHCPDCLHWGLLRGDVYLNPLSLLPPWLLNGGPSRLLPVLGVPLPGRAGVSPARPAAPWRPPHP